MIPVESLARPFPAAMLALQAEAEWRLWVDVLADVATIVISIALILVGVGVVVAALGLRRLLRRVGPVLERLRVDVQPIIRHGTTVAENVDYVSTAVRADVEQLQKTIASANQRVNRMAAMAEDRVKELNALLEVVQEEAEDLFIGTASTMRGVRAGAEALSASQEEEHGEPGEPEDELEIRVRRT